MSYFYVYGKNGDIIAIRKIETNEIYYKKQVDTLEWDYLNEMVLLTEENKKDKKK